MKLISRMTIIQTRIRIDQYSTGTEVLKTAWGSLEIFPREINSDWKPDRDDDFFFFFVLVKNRCGCLRGFGQMILHHHARICSSM